ncbi:hypothetical protein ITJ86_04380 [Winogradskyella sp. F6397]|uniref:Uncharacterized protein n=1 Tax=Winogradskyella marina TaxID=2785530 RepID=A0ABS0EF90_9FLAO|nr:hypothetical protein [Winogradskyella marina]MBF8149119.1 hypothetical protein [Winogradskyella marina]
MARQKGLFKITGTLGAVNFYVVKGVGYARKAGGGFNGNAIRTQPNMQRVRENASEFGHCSQVKKAFRLALSPFLSDIKGRALHTRLMQLFLGIKALDGVSERGQRRVTHGLQTAKGKRLLSRFVFTPRHQLLDALSDRATFDWSSQQFTVSDFNFGVFKSPKSATHIGVTLGVLDFDFDGLSSTLSVSPTQLLEVGTASASFTLVPDTMISTEYTGIAILGLRFCEVVDGEVYGLNGGIGCCVLGCEV